MELREGLDAGPELRGLLSRYPFDSFRNYPARDPLAWIPYLERRLMEYARDPGHHVVTAREGEELAGLIAFRLSRWDTGHFGFPVAQVDHLITAGGDHTRASRADDALLERFEEWRAREHVHFATARPGGDDLPAIHGLEGHGFRYIENILWPVVDLRPARLAAPRLLVRPHRPEDLDRVRVIAAQGQYDRGRFHADPRFDRTKVEQLQASLIDSSLGSGFDLTVVEVDGSVHGAFLHRFDADLSSALGARIGRWRFAAISPEARGRGVGNDLFAGTLLRMRESCDFVDSGFATKNLASMNLHWKLGFRVAHDAVTYHRWYGLTAAGSPARPPARESRACWAAKATPRR